MSRAYLLDTSFVSIAQRDSEVAARLTATLADCATASVVLHELRYGLARMPAGKKKRLIAEFMQSVVARLDVLPYDARAAEWQAGERARLESVGKPRPFVDGLVAATAVAHGRVLVTANPRDFAGYRDLDVVDSL